MFSIRISKLCLLVAASMSFCSVHAAAYSGPAEVTWDLDSWFRGFYGNSSDGAEGLGLYGGTDGHGVIRQTRVAENPDVPYVRQLHSVTWRAQLTTADDGTLQSVDGISGFSRWAYGSEDLFSDWRIDADGKVFVHLTQYSKFGDVFDRGEVPFAQLSQPQVLNARGDISYTMTLSGYNGSAIASPGKPAGILTISAVPEPGAVALTFSGALLAGGLAMARRRRMG